MRSTDLGMKMETDSPLYVHVRTRLLKRVGNGKVPTRLAEHNRFPSEKQLPLQVSAVSYASSSELTFADRPDQLHYKVA